MKNDYNLPIWEYLAKRMIWEQIGNIKNQVILDFGSGNGATANYFAKENVVTAVEPNEIMLKNQVCDCEYNQIVGGIDVVRSLPTGVFDWIFCHNVLEYVDNKEEIIIELCRLLKAGGKLSVVKHNRNGRVMQMAVLLNNFESAENLLNGGYSESKDFGSIRYYDDSYITQISPKFRVVKNYGLRTFWDLQQRQEIQSQADWQEKMLKLEHRVSDIDEFKAIAFFHHIIFQK